MRSVIRYADKTDIRLPTPSRWVQLEKRQFRHKETQPIGAIQDHAYAAAYLPRARRLARVWGVDWPERFETATWKRLHETLSIEPSYARA
ncbi:hypothetical protein DLJ53_33660 [Acuticoccus sediminis]|uniref:Uncharacterized protein n=1 Tax=Acuticoccus sediminis TaxID=2184697 RepID=A0A8B2NJE7_9HYPH|nr:hypothetical protein DLJ53_33660 [Acuticoccus sediminis]